MAEKTNKLTVGLIRADLTEVDEIVKPDVQGIAVEEVGTFYTERSRPRPPGWITDFFGNVLGDNLGIITSSAKGVLLVPVADGNVTRTFPVIFGHGRHLLRDGVLEERFGLKVVLNSVDPDSLRSIDKTALGSVPKQSREQISREGGAASFGIDIEQDLVNSVTGKSRIERFGRTITGRDTFSASAKFDVRDVVDFLTEALEQSRKETYKDRFDWIDQIKDVRSRDAIDVLNNELVRRLQAGELDDIWMAPPDIIDWADAKGFRYLRKRSPLFPDLDVADLISAAGDHAVDLEWLKNSNILLVSAANDDVVGRPWPAYKCIYAEIEIGGAMHVLNAGKWFQVAEDFTALVNADFEDTPECPIELPEYRHGNENLYNLDVTAALPGSHCMDADLIMHGGGQSRIEFCDVLTPDRTLLHVKRYSGSAQLSHLFSQGVVSAELLLSDAEFRRKLNDKLPDAHKLADFNARPDPAQYEVVFVVISKSANPLNLPFFSKVSLRNARRRLQAYGFRVSRKKVRAIANEAA